MIKENWKLKNKSLWNVNTAKEKYSLSMVVIVALVREIWANNPFGFQSLPAQESDILV